MEKENSLEKNAGKCPFARTCFEDYNLCNLLNYNECEYYKQTEIVQSLVNKSLAKCTIASQYNNKLVKNSGGRI
ncbi:MAG TPA: hypothetical protein PK357_02525 [Candidatus Pacearchaeota archaeon]|nr:hypothetical protein [Candidatus Pacearchaeota archaeon]